MQRTCDYFRIPRVAGTGSEVSTSEFLHFAGDDPEFLVDVVFRNKQRTSTRGGILKAQAVIDYLKVLQAHNVERFDDVKKVTDTQEFDQAIKQVKGQNSGISTRYLFMLAGDEIVIKPGRMIMRFIENGGSGAKFNCSSLR